MTRTLICSHRPLIEDLRPTVLGRQDVERYLAADAHDAREIAQGVSLDLALVDAEMSAATEIVRALRRGPARRILPIAVVARHGTEDAPFRELLLAGANELLRLPPAADWDDRLLRLLPVPPRRDARCGTVIDVDARGIAGRARLAAHDVSAGGMLIECPRPLALGEKLRVTFSLPRAPEPLVGTAWVVRKGPPSRWGLEFLYLDGDGVDRLRQFVHSSPPAPPPA